MNLIKFLIPKEKIVGIEISSEKLRMLYLEQDAYGKINIKGKSKIDLNDGVIVNGEVKNKKELSAALDALKKSFVPKKYFSNFAVITIPPNRIYSSVQSFPKILDNSQLLEAITTNARDNFPFALSSCYFDWEIIEESGDKYQVLISMAPKKIIDEYIEAIKSAGFELIALETHFLSLERLVDLPESPVMMIYLNNDGLNSVVFKSKRPYFNQFETWQEASGGTSIRSLSALSNMIKSKINMISLRFESKNESETIKKVLLAGRDLNVAKLIKNMEIFQYPVESAGLKLKFPDDEDWLPASGAAARAFIPRSDDTVISLLPVGTESLYETQKAISFSKSILFFLFSLSLFYVSVLLAFFLFFSSLEKNLSHQLSINNSVPISGEYSKMASDTKEFNSYASDISKIKSSMKNDYSSSLIDKINALAVTGTSFTGISINDSSKVIYITGISSSRESYRYFKNKISASADFSDAALSSSDIAKKTDINFSATMHIK